jgi:DNA replication and repair protein RecF
MHLVQFRASNFRLFQDLSLSFHDRLNVFFGANAAGKTTLLEAVYSLGRGKSFRASGPQELAGPAGANWTVFARQAVPDQPARQLGLQWTSGGFAIRINGEVAGTLELLRSLPVQVLEPGMHRVLQEGPTYRRSFLDWGVFHVEPQFLECWRRYRRALRQRNHLLRQQGGPRELAVWEPELAETGEALHGFRRQHLDRLRPMAESLAARFLDEGDWSFELTPGWPADKGLAEALAEGRDRDRRLGSTHDGPHRAELRIRAGARSARSRISRGQQKLLIAALLLAQCEQIRAVSGIAPVLLVDDFPAELAQGFQAHLIEALLAYPGQVFITAFEPTVALHPELNGAMFHVERGHVTPWRTGS